MARTTLPIRGPIATNAEDWPPLRRRPNSDDQTTLENLLKAELDAHWRTIAREDGLTEDEHAEKERRNRSAALRRSIYGDVELLRRFVANSVGPDGKRLGDEIAEFIRWKGEKHKKAPKDHAHEAQESERLRSLTFAVWEAERAKAILERVYGRTPDDYAHRTDLIVAAKRAGVSEDEIRKWKEDRRRPDDPWPVPTERLSFD